MKVMIESHPLTTWFPPDDKMASLMARLCILREDWWIEFNGYTSEDKIKVLDSNSQFYRRLYFLRNLIKTLNEIYVTLDALNGLSEFRSALDGIGTEGSKVFREGLKFLKENQELIRKVRNNLGGHVSQEGLARSLANCKNVVEGACSISTDHNHTHFRFARELCSLVLFQDAFPDKVKLIFNDLHLRIRPVIHNAFIAYVKARGLIE